MIIGTIIGNVRYIRCCLYATHVFHPITVLNTAHLKNNIVSIRPVPYLISYTLAYATPEAYRKQYRQYSHSQYLISPLFDVFVVLYN